MGPRLFSRGNDRILLSRFGGWIELQWCRDSSVAEIAPPTENDTGNYLLQWGRDSSVAEIAPPTENDTGNYLLQWGRDSSVAEIEPLREV